MILCHRKFSKLISSDYSIVKPFKNLNIGILKTITIEPEIEPTNNNNHLKYSTSLYKKIKTIPEISVTKELKNKQD